MGQFNPNWDEVQPGFGALDKGDYVFDIGEVKAFKRAKKDQQTGEETGEFSQGLGIHLRTPDGQKAYHNLYMTENTAGMVLAFLMCAYGFDPNDKNAVAEFKAQYGRNMNVDFDTMEVGSAYIGITGNKIKATNEPRIFAGALQNNFRWRPF